MIAGNAAAREKADNFQAVACLIKPFELDEMPGLVRRITRPEEH